jgi:hypothetical protein
MLWNRRVPHKDAVPEKIELSADFAETEAGVVFATAVISHRQL